MNNKLKKALCSLTAITALASGTTVLPVFAQGYTPLFDGDVVLNEWKFDFGSADNVMDGYTAVTPDRNVFESKDYGFLGNTENSYKVPNSDKYDSFVYQMGQSMNLQVGGNGENDGIGIVALTDSDTMYPEFTTGDYHPVSFGMYVENGSYYRVRATVTTLDSTKDAKASLYYERRHPVYKQKTISAGETYTVDFSVDVETINFKNEGNFKDDMLNISLLGDNAAISSVIIQQIDENASEKPTTLWVLGDSTVTDGSAGVPYFDLQNYTGVGSHLSRYVPSYVAVSNQGEGGLNATDNNHFAIARDNIKKGDYMYVQYGHNHKNSNGQSFTGEYWLHNYLNQLPKYYNACKAVGATLVVVGPIDRHNDDQYNSTTNTWSSTLNGFSDIGKKYVDTLMYGGETAASAFIAKWSEIAAEAEKKNNTAELKAQAEKICSDAVEGGVVKVENVAFTDLNRPTLDWLSDVTKSGTVNNVEQTNNKNLSKFYFMTARGGKTDGTHPNDAGADALAYRFFTTSDTTAYPALLPLTENFADGNSHEVPNPVSDEIINAGFPSNRYWPMYDSPVKYDYALKINSVGLDDTNTFKTMNVTIQDNSMMSTYGQGYVAVYNLETGLLNGIAMTTDHVDNTNNGTVTLNFDTDVAYNPETQTYKAFIWGYEDNPEKGNPSTMVTYSRVYTPTDIEAYLLPGDESDVETFEYYLQTTLEGAGNWSFGGSMDKDLTLGKDDQGVSYATIKSTGNGNSYYVMRNLENISDKGTGTTGKYMIDLDVSYTSGKGLRFGFAESVTPNRTPFVHNMLTAFEIGADGAVTASGKQAGTLPVGKWTNIKYIIDIDHATAEVTVGSGTPVTVTVGAYNTMETPVPSTLKAFAIEGAKANAFDVKISNMTVAKLKSSNLEDKTITVSSDNEEMGTVSISGTSKNTYTAVINSPVAISASALDGYEFVEWQNEDGTNFSYVPALDLRLHRDLNLTAVFKKSAYDPINYKYKEDFSKMSTALLSGDGWKSPNAQDAMTIATDTDDSIGNYLRYGKNDNSRGAAKDFGTTYTDKSGLVFSADLKFNKGNTDPNEFVVHSGNITYNSNNINYGCTGGYVLNINQASNGSVKINDVSAEGFPDNAWVTVMAKCDFTAHTVDVTVKSLDGNTTYYSGTVNMADTAATGISGLYFKFGKRAYGVVSMDNIKIYPMSDLNK